jgi:hypothetical protein
MTDRQLITIALCAFVAVGSVVIAFAARPAEYPTITAARGGGTSEHGRKHETSTTVPAAERDAISQSAPAVTSEGAKNSSGDPKPTTTTRRSNNTNVIGALLAPTGRTAPASLAIAPPPAIAAPPTTKPPGTTAPPATAPPTTKPPGTTAPPATTKPPGTTAPPATTRPPIITLPVLPPLL